MVALMDHVATVTIIQPIPPTLDDSSLIGYCVGGLPEEAGKLM